MRRAAALLSLLLVALTGCGSSGNGGGVISGDGQIVEFPHVADRGAPVDLAGTSLDGRAISLAAYRGKVVVVNIWWSGCGPCITEAPKLQSIEASGKAVVVGIDVRDTSADQGLAFERAQGVTYPSIYSADGSAVLAFSGQIAPGIIPATIVLDAQGRVVAVVRGAIQGNDTLKDLVADASKAAS